MPISAASGASSFRSRRMVYLINGPAAGPGEGNEAPQENKDTPLEKADKKFKSELNYTAMRILVKYRETFKDEKDMNDEKKQKEFVDYGESQIKNVNAALTPADLQLLKDSGKYNEGYEFVNPFVTGRTTVHFQAKINNDKKVEPVIEYEEKKMG